MAIYHLTKSITKRSDLLWAGLWLGLAISMRYQTIFILIGILIALLIQKTSIKSLLTIFFSFAIMFFFGTVLFDLIVWKRPFAELSEYIKYNLNNANNYGFDNPHMYFDLIFGLLIPPLSIILFCGYFYSWKKTQFIFWPVFIYLVFHTYFPNKQERFILTVLPLIIISGTIGMFQLYEKYGNRLNKKLIFFSRRFVVIINLILLPILSVSYSKRHRVEAMYYMYKKNDSANFLIEDSNKKNDYLAPALFYYGKWKFIVGISKKYTASDARRYYNDEPEETKPKYIVFWQTENIDERIDSVKKSFPNLKYETTIEASFLDKTLHWLNPLNDNQTSYIYRIEN